jgi:RNA polymerase sigma-70 factor (ECF subfamily)
LDDATDALIARARAGDAHAAESLLCRHLPALRAFIRLRSDRRLRDRESVSDLVQSVCREVLQDLPDFAVASDAAFRHWLYTSALRKILDRKKYWGTEKRDPRREQSLDAAGPATRDELLLQTYRGIGTPSRHASLREEVERLEAAFDELPDDYREVLTLAKVVGLSHREIAERLGRSEEAARQLLSRARARLARLLS